MKTDNSIQQIQQALDSSTIVAITDVRGDIIYANEKFCQISQYSEEELLGQNHRILNSGHHSQSFFKKLWRTISNGDTWKGEIKNRAKDGSYYWVDTTIVPILNEEGKPEQYVAIRVDVTQRKLNEEKIREGLLRNKAVLDTAVDAIITIDTLGLVESMNGAAEKMTGYRVNEVAGRNVNMLMPQPYRSNHDVYLRNYIRTGEKKIIGIGREVMVKRKDGSSFPAELAVSEMDFGDRKMFTGILRDMTERKQREEALRASNEKLLQSNRELEQFAYVASHDLQEPLRVISSFGNILMKDYRELLDDDGKDYLDRIDKASQRMKVLIQDLLSLSRVTTCAKPMQAVPLNRVFEELLADLAVKIREVRGEVLVDELPIVIADPTQVRQLFQNLVNNALKFHKKDVPPVVRVEVREMEGSSQLEILVIDNGIGFEEEYQDKIFKIFQRLQGRDQYEGTGIGLAVCRKITDRHEWTVRAESKPDEGSTFIVSIPEIMIARESSAPEILPEQPLESEITFMQTQNIQALTYGMSIDLTAARAARSHSQKLPEKHGLLDAETEQQTKGSSQ